MPSRLFDQHQIRQVTDLGGTWELHLPKRGSQIEPKSWRRGQRLALEIPGCWEQIERCIGYRGQGVFRRRFRSDGGHVRLVFKGVSHTARVLVDGTEVGGHHNAFTAFTLDLGKLRAGEHEVLVHVSNEHGDISALHMPNDYYDYGGITRPVEVQELLGDCCIDAIRATPRCTRGRWSLHCEAELRNHGQQPVDCALKVSCAGVSIERTISCEPGTSSCSFELKVGAITAWSPASPQLYLLEAVLQVAGQAIDDWRDRVGFRTVSSRGSRLLLNGEPLYLLGFNRHEDHPDYGNAIPVSIMRRDLRQFLDLGCNAVRTSHYPNDERFLDLCDELGLMVWEENHARGLNLEKMQHPRFREQCYAVTEEMVRQHHNRPSIVIWGIMNECASESTYGRELYAEQFALIERLDPSRPTTYASCRHEGDICQDLPQVCSWNIYPLWYGDDATSTAQVIADHVTRFRAKGMGSKPLIISEIGAGALPGFHDPVRRGKWSEERQGDILEAQCRDVLDSKRVTGLLLWQFCDVRVHEDWALRRPRAMNNKGVVDQYRQPKLAYAVVQRQFRAFLARWGNPAMLPAAAPLDVIPAG